MTITKSIFNISVCVASVCILFGASLAEADDTLHSAKTTLGLAPPPEATVLFDGSGFDAWKPFSFMMVNPKDTQKEIQWKLVDDEAMQISLEFEGKRRLQWLSTRSKFGDYRLHLEFKLPDAGTGNSGLFFGPLYELQLIKSGKLESVGVHSCGAIYGIHKPNVNAALPQGQWQTIDLEYQAVRLNKRGQYIERNAARVSVRLNGKLIHDDVKLSLRRNKYAAYPEEPQSPIVLQEHGSPVMFRNIWLVEGTKETSAKEIPAAK